MDKEQRDFIQYLEQHNKVIMVRFISKTDISNKRELKDRHLGKEISLIRNTLEEGRRFQFILRTERVERILPGYKIKEIIEDEQGIKIKSQSPKLFGDFEVEYYFLKI